MIDRANAIAKQYAGHPREPRRGLFEPSKEDLRHMLAEAARNTGAVRVTYPTDCVVGRYDFGEGEV